MELHPKVKTTKQLSTEAFKELKKIQSGEKSLVKTGAHYIDKHLGGLLPSSVWLHGAPSGVGKTTVLMKAIRNILSEDVNKNAKDFVSLEFMLEMKFLNLIIRDANNRLGKLKSEILSEEFTEEEKQVMREYAKSLEEPRRFIVDEVINSKEFFEICDDFCGKNIDKQAIIISLDHLLLVTSYDKNEDTFERLATYTNILAKKYSNVYFIYLSQVNRTFYNIIAERNNNMVPTVSTIYGSSHFEFLASYVTINSIPFRLGIQEYMKVKPERYPNLINYSTQEDKKGYISFNTMGNSFFHIAKVRDSDDIFDNLHIETLSLSQDQLDKMKTEIDVKQTEKVEFPKFDFDPPSVVPQIHFKDLDQAF